MARRHSIMFYDPGRILLISTNSDNTAYIACRPLPKRLFYLFCKKANFLIDVTGDKRIREEEKECEETNKGRKGSDKEKRKREQS